MAAMDQKAVELACALLERGYSDQRMEAAVAHCTELEEALEWLNSTPLTAEVKPPLQSGDAVAAPMRRHSRKRPLKGSGSASSSSAALCCSGEPEGLQLSGATEECSLCCCEVPTGEAARLGCGHGWYCVVCMTKHAEARLAEGAVDVNCPQCRTSVPERDLKELLPAEVGERLQARSLASAVSKAADLRHCPTPDCPMVVALEDAEARGTLRFRCPMCRRASCLSCSAQPFHRGFSCGEHAARRRRSRSGGRAEEGLLRWLRETGTPQCPTCGMAVTKQNLARQCTQYQECHKMICRNCSTRFCFKCVQVLTESFSCGCSADGHHFVDPLTEGLVPHLKRGVGRPPSARGREHQGDR